MTTPRANLTPTTPGQSVPGPPRISSSLNESLRSLPSVDRLLNDLSPLTLPRPLILHIIRTELNKCRQQLAPIDELLSSIQKAIADVNRDRLQPLINATGIIIHTNFGRSPLAATAIAALHQAAENYTNLEFDLATGVRGNRARSVEESLAILSRAESTTVVNNCAAALVLTLHAFAAIPPKNEVIISRGELVQIGGGFRIPEILESTGATLREVGTTNRTSVDDYVRAISPHTAMILKVHHSNFAMSGFVESASLAQLAPLARAAKIPLVDDLGSGAVTRAANEPTPADSLAHGADLVLFSGDKLLGGPQAGIIAGSASAVTALKRNPLFRALRCDKLILAALQATVDLHLAGQTAELPIFQMMNATVGDLQHRAEAIAAALPDSVRIAHGVSRIGGGAAPEATIPSIVLKIAPTDTADACIARLRHAPVSVIGYIEAGQVLLDLRTVFPSQDALLTDAIRLAVAT